MDVQLAQRRQEVLEAAVRAVENGDFRPMKGVVIKGWSKLGMTRTREFLNDGGFFHGCLLGSLRVGAGIVSDAPLYENLEQAYLGFEMDDYAGFPQWERDLMEGAFERLNLFNPEYEGLQLPSEQAYGDWAVHVFGEFTDTKDRLLRILNYTTENVVFAPSGGNYVFDWDGFIKKHWSVV